MLVSCMLHQHWDAVTEQGLNYIRLLSKVVDSKESSCQVGQDDHISESTHSGDAPLPGTA